MLLALLAAEIYVIGVVAHAIGVAWSAGCARRRGGGGHRWAALASPVC